MWEFWIKRVGEAFDRIGDDSVANEQQSEWTISVRQDGMTKRIACSDERLIRLIFDTLVFQGHACTLWHGHDMIKLASGTKRTEALE